jgi:hypothetical protein
MPDYSKSKIYSIRSHKTDKVYIGSTILALSARFAEHRRFHRFYLSGGGKGRKNGCRSSELMEFDDVYIELVEEYPCENKEQLLKREGEIIRNTPNAVNRCIAGRNKKQWDEDNKEHIKQYQKEYDAKRAEKKKEYNRLYRLKQKEIATE